ncbi:putative LINE-1 retrotransposable element ORF2 protein [Apostichopus japonicus]|uniref:Putative LINE-1 retrotransposable element ORF2 protein n=1 Tax=Stichopus japonicus TaxID=307972 RepID=A0A2G8KJK6_STIJA|nr:putative LINE-1 retrotransposable element ORF2 protein [Apostichopus japonicus]
MIYTASFKIGHIPQIWKSATTIVIPKPGKDHKHPGSYRPISLLPVLGKCLEKIIAGRQSTKFSTSNRSTGIFPGRDGIQYLHLKAAPPILLEALSMIYTASFKIGHIPQIWKSATTIVIPKPGKDHKHPGSYRPISLLPVLGKCLEKIIARRLYKFIEDYNIIPDSQAGFRRNRSTTDQLFHFLQHTSTHRTKGHHTIAAFFDAEKAFDRMWHEGLLLKLRKYNLPTKLTRWIASFLSHRTTNFKIGSSFSSPLHITTGTPQGSTISPILYIMYVGDIPQPENRFTQISQYADDIAIWTSHINPVRTEEYLQQYINSINQWCHDWRLELNPKKSQILYIAKHNRLRRQPYLTLNNTVIPVTNQVRS